MNRTYVKVVDSQVSHHSVDELWSSLGSPGHGAKILFTGVVRNSNLGKKVLAVSYDAFIPMTEKVFLEICEEARARSGPDLDLLLVHRIGRLEVGEISIAIVASSPHRDEAYQASRFIIENVKHRAPIWKKEHYEDGETQWLEGHALCSHSE